MAKPGIIDEAALAAQFAQASRDQGEALRQAVEGFTLQALRSRELTVKSIREVLRAATQAASTGLANHHTAEADAKPLLAQALAGMDAALVQAVEANRRTLAQFVDEGGALREPRVKRALADLRRMEDVLFDAVGKAIDDGARPLQAPWSSVLEIARSHGSATGASASAAIAQLTERAHEVLRSGRAFQRRSASLWMEHYAALVSGVFIGMSHALSAHAEPAQFVAASDER